MHQKVAGCFANALTQTLPVARLPALAAYKVVLQGVITITFTVDQGVTPFTQTMFGGNPLSTTILNAH